MGNHLRLIPVESLRVGMFVAHLDRPWLETPFLFQGFYIRNEGEIEDLRRYCQSVEIDIEQSDARLFDTASPVASTKEKKSGRPSANGRDRSFWGWLLSLFGWKRKTLATQPGPGEYYKDTVSTTDELVVARTLRSGALDKLMNVMERIRSGREVSMPELEIVTGAMVDSVLRNSTAMSLLVRLEEKGEYTGMHSFESSVWALVFGRHLGLDRDSLNAVGLGGLLMDIGKARIPARLLNKTGELTDVEIAYLRTHVELGIEILKESANVDRRVLEMVATHHERFDGSGYPKGLKGNDIPVFGRIGGIVDSYSAMINDRPYAAAMSSFDAMREFKALADKHFQAEMVEQFIQAIGVFPVGTLVELNTGQVGVVLKENPSSRLQPEIAVILDANKEPVEKPPVIKLEVKGDPSPTVWIANGVEPGAYDIDARKYFL
ncbi:MAG: HD-GYP domain-containing protein [Woeseiaceae bacterium]|nr:HD-GYP domain-containing protein [Woeseiaceae bacterium]